MRTIDRRAPLILLLPSNLELFVAERVVRIWQVDTVNAGHDSMRKSLPESRHPRETACGWRLLFGGVGKTGRLDHCVAPNGAIFGDGGRKLAPVL